MATRFDSTLFPSNNTDALFRAWAGFIEDTLVATGGWTVSTETGDTAPGSLIHPTVTNTKQGFRIYKMADSLQATYPVYMRIDYGSAAAALTPGFWVTIGTGSDGSGTITGLLWNGGASPGASVSAQSNSTSQATISYGSAGTARASIGLFIQSASGSYPMVFTIERTKNSSGADTGDGLLLAYNDSALGIVGALTYSRYIIYAGGTQPSAEQGVSYVMTRNNPSETFAPGDIGVGILIHFKGLAQQPGTNVVFSNSSDVAGGGNFSLTLYGATRTYQNLDIRVTPYKALSGSATQDISARVNIRYD